LNRHPAGEQRLDSEQLLTDIREAPARFSNSPTYANFATALDVMVATVADLVTEINRQDVQIRKLMNERLTNE
jgi:hypothetical protein